MGAGPLVPGRIRSPSDRLVASIATIPEAQAIAKAAVMRVVAMSSKRVFMAMSL